MDENNVEREYDSSDSNSNDNHEGNNDSRR